MTEFTQTHSPSGNQKVAIENPLFIDDFPIERSIHHLYLGDCPLPKSGMI